MESYSSGIRSEHHTVARGARCCPRAPALDRLAEDHRRLRRLRLPRRRAVPGHQLAGLERRAQHRAQCTGRFWLPLRAPAPVPAGRRNRLAVAGPAIAACVRPRPRPATPHSAGRRHPAADAAPMVAGGRHRPRRRESADHDPVVLQRDPFRPDAALVRRLRPAPVVHRLPAGLLAALATAARRSASPGRRPSAARSGPGVDACSAADAVPADPGQPVAVAHPGTYLP